MQTLTPRSSSAAPGVARRSSRWQVWRHLDVVLVAAVIVISAFGTLMIYTATRNLLEAQGISPTYYAQKQALFLLVGIVVMLVVAAIDYRKYRDWALVIYGISVLMLLAVLVVGHKSRGAQAWFQFGSFQLEPSEVAKVGLIVALAAYCAACKGNMGRKQVIAVLLLAAVPFLLIYKQPDLGTALILAVVLATVLVVAGVRARHLAILALIGVGIMAAVVQLGVLKGYQESRLSSFLSSPNQPNPKLLQTVAGANEYNVAEAKITIGDGGLLGRGIGKGSQTNLAYVPEQQTDFIFTAVGEQVGFVGSALLLLLFAVVVWRTWRAATLSRDLFGTLLCTGVLGALMFSIFENVGMAMGIMPVAGIPLPFMSYGGSAMVSDFAAIGLVLNVRMRRFG